MQRRKIIKYLAFSIGGTITLPAWANAWNAESIKLSAKLLTTNQEALLAELTEAIIPKTDSPGAKDLAIPQFIQKIVKDCYDKKAQEIFKAGFGMLDDMTKRKLGNSFTECSSVQRTEIVQSLEKEPDSDLKKFYQMIKGLTIWGFTTSEFVMMNHYKYAFIPGKFKPCVEVPK
jgi:hypothetical protein